MPQSHSILPSLSDRTVLGSHDIAKVCMLVAAMDEAFSE